MTARTRILIAEDEAIVALDIQDRLEAAGYEVIGLVDTAEEAIQVGLEQRPDLVLMDIHLKGHKDGIAAAEELGRSSVPVVFLTAYADEPTVARAKTSEPFGYLLKPCRERELHSALQMALARADAERRLRQSERRHAATLRSIGDALVVVDAAGRVTQLNPVAERLTGWSEEAARGQPIENVLVLVDERTRQGVPNPAKEALRENAVVQMPPHVLLVTRDGREIPVEDSAAPIRDDGDGPPPGAVLAFRDVSERNKSEMRLRTAQRLESLGVLAGGIAHDFNNLLTPILGYAGLAREVVPPDSPAVAMLRQVERAASSAAELSQQMLAYAGYNRFTRERVNLSALVEETAGLLRHAVGTKADLQLALSPTLPLVEADPAQLRQVLLNLVTNAVEALQGRSGTVLVRTQSVEADRQRLQSPFCQEELPEGPYVLLQVADNGCGMDEVTAARIFDPFFTTKFQGRGLGLAAVLGIVRSHRGVIQVHSRPSRGTTVEALLPVAPQ